MPNLELEDGAARLVNGLLHGVVMPIDRKGAPPKSVDFHIVLGSKLIALEVTSAAVSNWHIFWDNVNKLDWRAKECTQGWSLSLDAPSEGDFGANPKRIRPLLEPHLAALEAAGVDRFGRGFGDPPDEASRRAVMALSTLGVRAGVSLGVPAIGAPPNLLVGTSGPAGITGSDDLNEAVQTQLALNSEKLQAAPVDERHLFLWVPTDNSRLWAALSGIVPMEAPQLPDWVDCVWVALWAPGPSIPTNTLWSVIRGSGWGSRHVRFAPKDWE